MNSSRLTSLPHPTFPWIALAAGSALVLAACSDQPDPSPPPTPPPARTTPLTIEDLIANPPPEVEQVLPGADWPMLAFRTANEGLPTGGTWREEPLLHDFTGSGRASIVASNREEDGLNAWELVDGVWQLRIDGMRRDLMYGGSVGADFDGDGDEDLLFASHKSCLVLYLNDGSMRWEQGPEIERKMLLIDVATGDLNGDGLHDAVGIGQFDGGIEVYVGDGKGNLAHRPESSTLDWIRFGVTIELADMDGDGLDDIITASNGGAKVLLTRMDAEGTLSWVDASEGLPAPAEGNTLRSVVPADILGDGKYEIVACRIGAPGPDANNFGVYRFDAENTRWNQIDSGISREFSYTEALAADFDNDGHLDILTAASFGVIAIHRGDGTGKFTLAGKLDGVRGQRPRAALGDVDGNGWTDVLLLVGSSKQDRGAGGLSVYLNGPDVWKSLASSPQ